MVHTAAPEGAPIFGRYSALQRIQRRSAFSFEQFKVVTQLRGGVITQLAVFLHRLAQHRLESVWQVISHIQRRARPAMQDGRHQQRHILSMEWPPPRGHLVEHGTKGKYVGAASELLAG